MAESSDVVISVDTFWPEVARAAIDAGADVVNDTTGLYYPELADVVADSEATLVVTHSLAQPRNWYPSPHYDDVVAARRRPRRRSANRADAQCAGSGRRDANGGSHHGWRNAVYQARNMSERNSDVA